MREDQTGALNLMRLGISLNGEHKKNILNIYNPLFVSL